MEVNQDYQEDKWQQYFANSKGQFELAVDTYLFFGNFADFYFEFEGSMIRWCNGIDDSAPVIIVPIQDEGNHDFERGLLRRFLSQLSYQQNIAIREISEIGSGQSRLKPWLDAPYHLGGFLVKEPLFEELENLSNRQKLALALFREALNTPSQYYSLLVYFKIIEIASGPNKTDEWIESHLDSNKIYGLQNWINQIPKIRTPGKYLREAQRNAVAHVDEILYKGDPTLNPDDLKQRSESNQVNDILKDLARMALNEVLPSP